MGCISNHKTQSYKCNLLNTWVWLADYSILRSLLWTRLWSHDSDPKEDKYHCINNPVFSLVSVITLIWRSLGCCRCSSNCRIYIFTEINKITFQFFSFCVKWLICLASSVLLVGWGAVSWVSWWSTFRELLSRDYSATWPILHLTATFGLGHHSWFLMLTLGYGTWNLRFGSLADI